MLDRANPTEAAVATLAGPVVHRKTLGMGLAFPAAKVGLELLGGSFVEPSPRRFIDVGKRLEWACLLYTSPSPRDQRGSRMPSSA